MVNSNIFGIMITTKYVGDVTLQKTASMVKFACQMSHPMTSILLIALSVSVLITQSLNKCTLLAVHW